MLIEVFDDDGKKDDLIGVCYTNMGKLIGAKNQTFMADLLTEKDKDKKNPKSTGKLTVMTETLQENSDMFEFEFKISNLKSKVFCGCLGSDNVFVLISRGRN